MTKEQREAIKSLNEFANTKYGAFTAKEGQTVLNLIQEQQEENKHLLNKDWYNICPFLNYKNECDIYENRPLICREYSCYNYEHNIYNLEAFSKIPEENFKITNVRKEIFNNEGV